MPRATGPIDPHMNRNGSVEPRTYQSHTPQPHLEHWNLARDACLPDENPADFDRLLRGFESEMRPQNALESAFVRQMADARWRLLRLVRWGFLGPVLYREGRLNKIVDPRATGNGHEGDLTRFGLDGVERSEALRSLAYYARAVQCSFSRAKKQIAFLRAEGRCVVDQQRTTKQ